MGELIGIARFRFENGDVAEYKRLAAQAMEIVRAKEPGTLQYDVYFNNDESEAIVVERFRDSAALLEHGANMQEISDAILKTGTAFGELLGEPNDELRRNLSDDGPVQLFTPFLTLSPHP